MSKKGGSAKAVANKALKEINQLKKQVNKTFEKKHHDKLLDLAIGSGGSNQEIDFQLSQGDGATSQRAGNKVTLQKVKLNMAITRGDTYNRLRCILVEPLDGNEPVGLADVLKYYDYSVYDDLVFTSPYTTKTATDRRYKIHYDTTVEVNAYNMNTIMKQIKLKFGKTGRVIHYNDSNLDPTSFRLQLISISDSGASPYPAVRVNARFTYIDA